MSSHFYIVISLSHHTCTCIDQEILTLHIKLAFNLTLTRTAACSILKITESIVAQPTWFICVQPITLYADYSPDTLLCEEIGCTDNDECLSIIYKYINVLLAAGSNTIPTQGHVFR